MSEPFTWLNFSCVLIPFLWKWIKPETITARQMLAFGMLAVPIALAFHDEGLRSSTNFWNHKLLAAQADFLESKKEWQAEATKIQQDSHQQEKKFAQVQEEALKKFFATPTPRSSEEIEKERAAGDEVKRGYLAATGCQKYLGPARSQ